MFEDTNSNTLLIRSTQRNSEAVARSAAAEEVYQHFPHTSSQTVKHSETHRGNKQATGTAGCTMKEKKFTPPCKMPRKCLSRGTGNKTLRFFLRKSDRSAQPAFPRLLAQKKNRKLGTFRLGNAQTGEEGWRGMKAPRSASQSYTGDIFGREGEKGGAPPASDQPRQPPVPARSPNDAMAPDSAARTRRPPAPPPSPPPRGENAVALQGPVRPWRADTPRFEPRLLQRERLWRQGRRVAAGRARGGGGAGRCQTESRAPRPARSHLALSLSLSLPLPESTRFSKWRVLSRGEGSGKTVANQRRRGEGGRGGGRGEGAARAERGWGERGALRPCAARGRPNLCGDVTAAGCAESGVWEGRALVAQTIESQNGLG